MEDLNRRGKEFINSWCDEKHGTTGRVPNLHYLQEEKATLLPLPKERYRLKELESRIISNDCYISIRGSKYSVPDIYATKTLYFRIIYGFRIEIYDRNKQKVLTLEASGKKHDRLTNPEHYEHVAPKISTSIPQIRRDFTSKFSNGKRYLEAAGRKFDQPTHHARRIMMMEDIYSVDILDQFIGYAVDHDAMDITSFKGILRTYNAGKLELNESTLLITQASIEGENGGSYRDDDSGLLRDCDYYEQNVEGGSNGN